MQTSLVKLEIEMESLKFTANHVWVFVDGTSVYIGVTELALNGRGPAVYIDLPVEGDEVLTCVPFGEIEFMEDTFDVNSPIEGEVVEINEILMNKLDMLPVDPYKKAWLVKIVTDDTGMLSSLLTKKEYEKKFNIELGMKNNSKKKKIASKEKTTD